MQESQTLPSPLKLSLSKQVKIAYVTDLELHRLSFLWTISNFSFIRNYARDVISSPQYACRDGMVGIRKVGVFGQKSPDQALWWLQLDPFSNNKEDSKEHICLDLRTDLKEVASNLEAKVFKKVLKTRFLNSNIIPDCFGLDDTLNIRCFFEILARVLKIEEQGTL
eukprot:GHVP01002552.1.p1 GENE.GHVP01002552.1~~GHVP01002552.1.p1  ORF type:complete len:191 (+),score=34.80 GHVP01002552.1:78-575(+)